MAKNLLSSLYADEWLNRSVFADNHLKKSSFSVMAWQMSVSLMINVLSLALPIMMLQVYDRIIPHKSYGTLAMLVVGVTVALSLDAFLRMARSHLSGWIAVSHEHAAGCAAIERFNASDLTAFDRSSIGTHLQNMTALSRLRDFYSGQALMAALDLPFVIVFLGLIAYLGGALVFVPLALLVAFMLMAVFYGTRLKYAIEQRTIDEDKKASFIVAVLTAIHTVKAMAMESFLMRRFDKAQANSTRASYHVALATGLSSILSSAFGQLSLILTVSIGAFFVMDGSLSVGGLSACTLLAGRTIQPVQRVLGTWLRMQDMVVSREQVEDLFSLPVHRRAQQPVPMTEGSIEVAGMTFSYDNEVNLLENVSLTVGHGEAIAITGDKGSGKSTLLQLLAGILIPDSGKILVDEIDPAMYGRDAMVGHIGYLPQEATIFKGTIMENITGFREDDASLALATEAAETLGLDDVVRSLPLGYQTVLNDSASDPVPPGIKQRIALARALMHKPSILLFDDADRALDKIGYNRLFSLMGRLKGRCTLVIVSHDQNLISLADRYYHLHQGRLVNQSVNPVQNLVFLSQPIRERGF